MTAIPNSKPYDLQEKTYHFGKEVRLFVKNLPRTIANIADVKQLVRSSGSVGANYIEANEAFSRKDFKLKIKICRKEAKESAHWLRFIIDTNNQQFAKEGQALQNEANELKRYFQPLLKTQNN